VKYVVDKVALEGGFTKHFLLPV